MTTVAQVWREPLERMRDEHRLVRVVRFIAGADRLDGYVVGVGQRWVLLAECRELTVDGFTAVRLRDLRSVVTAPGADVSRRVLEQHGTWPPVAPTITLDRTRDLVRDAYAHAGLVALHVEHDDPGVAFVGAPTHSDDSWLVLDEVTPQGVRDGGRSRWRYREITRVGFAGLYETSLLAVAGPMPPR